MGKKVDYKNLNASTRQRLAEFASTFDLTAFADRPGRDLLNSLLEDVTIPHSEALDPAIQAAIQTLANRLTDIVQQSSNGLTEAQMDGVFNQCATELFTGYQIGRAMLGTGRDVLHYSNPADQADNADRIIRLISDPHIDDRLEDAGAMPKVWELYRARAASQGPFSVLPKESQATISAASARGGMTLAVLEHDTFVEGGGSSVVAPSDIGHLAELAVAVLKVNGEMGLDSLHPGCGVLALEEVEAMKSSTQVYNSGDSDGFRMIVAAMPKSLDANERAMLGFIGENRYPAKAVEYLKAVIVAATELGFRDYSNDFLQMIKSKPAGD